MKRNLFGILIVLILVLSPFVTAYGAALNWGASSGEVDGYKVYYGTSASSPSNSVDVGNVTKYSLDNLPLDEKTQYYFCVTAYNAAGESPPCDPVAYTQQDNTPPAPPSGLTAK